MTDDTLAGRIKKHAWQYAASDMEAVAYHYGQWRIESDYTATVTLAQLLYSRETDAAMYYAAAAKALAQHGNATHWLNSATNALQEARA